MSYFVPIEMIMLFELEQSRLSYIVTIYVDTFVCIHMFMVAHAITPAEVSSFSQTQIWHTDQVHPLTACKR